MTLEFKPFRRLLIGTVALGMCAVSMYAFASRHGESWQQQSSLNQQQRSLQLTEYGDPKTTSPRIRGENIKDIAAMNIHIYVKTSGKPQFLERSVRIADTYGRDVARDGGSSIRFLFDNHNHEAVDEFARDRPWISVLHVEGTDDQGGYKEEQTADSVAYKAQRLKTRAVFLNEDVDDAMKTDADPVVDWVCYFDDDMLVNFAILKADLHEKEAQCLSDCLIGDKVKHSGTEYLQGGYCMNRDLARRVGNLLREKTDEELHWDSTDDVSFNKYVMFGALGVLPMDSNLFYSELAWRRRSPKYVPGMSIPTFGEQILPNLAVYHIRFKPLQ